MSQTHAAHVAREDAWVLSSAASANHSAGNRLGLQSAAAYAYLRFPLPRDFKPTQERTVTVAQAILHVYTRGSWGVTPTLTAKRISEPWGLEKITWNNKPAVVGSGATVSHSSAVNGDEFAIDVTSLMQTVANGADWYGLRVETSNGSLKYLFSRNAEDQRYLPVLELTWSEAPEAPTRLKPSGNRSVSIAKPVVTFDFTDRAGSTSLSNVQVQVNATNAWTSPSFDSGTVSATEPELDLSATAYSGLTAGSSAWWRVRVQDGAGLWSAWSDGSQFHRDNKGTLSISNPAASPNNFVTEWTPEFIWALSGETQVAYQVIVAPDDDRQTWLWDSGRTKGTDISIHPPKGILVDDETYQLTVRIWDSKDREATPGDPVWTQVSRSFTVNESALTGHVSSLTAVQIADGPYITLTFVRSTAPDSFTVRRNDASAGYKTVDSDLDPADLFVSGTTYQYVDRDAPPNKSHDYKVLSVVNGKASNGNPVATVRNDTIGIWLFDHDLDLEVFVNNGDSSQFDSGEQSTWFDPMGSSTSRLVTQGMQGLTGTIVGTLTSANGRTAEAWTDRMYRIKGRAGKRVRLTLGDDAIPVVLSNVVISPVEDSASEKNLSFQFRQTGDLQFRYRG